MLSVSMQRWQTDNATKIDEMFNEADRADDVRTLHGVDNACSHCSVHSQVIDSVLSGVLPVRELHDDWWCRLRFLPDRAQLVRS